MHADGFVKAPEVCVHAPIQQLHERALVQSPVKNGLKKSVDEECWK